MITSGLYTSNDQTWGTPQSLFDELNKEFNFTLDPCCVKETAKCDKYYTPSENGLIQDWSKDIVFVNPPYGREINKWVEKCYNECVNGSRVVMLIPARTDTSYFHKFIYPFSLDHSGQIITEIRFLKGRVKFVKNGESGPAPFPSMIVIFNPKIST